MNKLIAFLAWGLYLSTAVLAQHPDPDGMQCRSCHEDTGQGRVLHAPVTDSTCTDCHLYDEKSHEVRLVAEEVSLCSSCHQDQTSFSMKHAVLETGGCVTCHDPHSSNFDGLLLADAAELCSACHDSVLAGRKFVHGPAAAQACVACHNPHGSEFPNLTVAEGSKLCLMCHVELDEKVQKAQVIHAPVTIDCALCHDPHESDQRYQLRSPPKALCLSCHDSIAEELAKPVSHDAVSTGQSCLNCHEPHVADHTALLLSDNETVCLSCHGEPVRSEGKELADMAALLEQNPDHHGPIQDRDCSTCHQPHGSQNFRLLFATYPAAFYSDFREEDYELCFTCHDPALVRETETLTLTGFRDGSRNLHYLHVHRAKKGRTCRACHETHASTYPFHIRTSVPFGTWQMPLNFRQTPSGGSCSPGCHGPASYNREQAKP